MGLAAHSIKRFLNKFLMLVSITLTFTSNIYAQEIWLRCSNDQTTKFVEINLREMKLVTSDSEFEQFLRRFFPERHASNPDTGKTTYQIFSATDSSIKARTTVILTRNVIELNRYTLMLSEYWISEDKEYSQKLLCQKIVKEF